jgi:hypothetical protein
MTIVWQTLVMRFVVCDGGLSNAMKLCIYPPGTKYREQNEEGGFQMPAGGNIEFTPVKAKRLL